MKKRKKIFKNILLMVSFFISVVIFMFIYESISYVKYQGNNELKRVDRKVEPKDSPFLSINNQNKLDKHRAYIECMEKGDIMLRDCDDIQPIIKKISIENKFKENSPKYEPFMDFNASNLIIKLIYLFLIFSLFQQIYLFLLSKFDYFLDIFDFHKSEWAINVAPMFGLLGTFFSMAMLLNANNENIDTALVKNFFDAVMTTIIGIIFYIINFYLKVSIYPKIVEQKND